MPPSRTGRREHSSAGFAEVTRFADEGAFEEEKTMNHITRTTDQHLQKTAASLVPRQVVSFMDRAGMLVCALSLVWLVPGDCRAGQNVLLIIADDYGADAMGLYSPAETAPTPTLDALAAGGVRFTNCWANPVCSPTRACILTGRHGFRTGVGFPDDAIDLNEFTIADAMSTAGYATACIGKWHLSDETNGGEDNPNLMGFDYYSGKTGGSVGDYFAWSKTVNGVTEDVSNYATSENVDDAIAWIANQGAAPWFLWLAFNAAHTPYHLPPTDLHSYGDLPNTREDIASNPVPYFHAMIEAMDTEINRLLSSMAPEVIANTTVIFIGDNGTAGEVSPQVVRSAKGSLYEGGVWVPCIVSGPAVEGPVNRTHDALIHVVDIFDTIIEIAGVDPATARPEGTQIDSLSFAPYLADPDLPNIHTYSFAERFSQNGMAADGKTIRNESYKLIRFDDGHEEFFDIANDPTESRDLLAGGRTLRGTKRSNYEALVASLDTLLDSANGDWMDITYDNFEDGWGSYASGGVDCMLSTKARHASEGSNSANIQDDSEVASSFCHASGYDVSFLTELKVEFTFKMVSMDTGEDFQVQYYDGSGWQTVATFSRAEFDNSTFHEQSIVIDRESHAFPQDAKIRFICNASANRDDVYIDEVLFAGR